MKKNKIRIAIAGCMGRMGQMLIKEIQKNKKTCLSIALVSKNSPFIEQDIGKAIGIKKMGVLINDTLNNNEFDVLIDFTQPKGTLEYLQYCQKAKKNIIIGTTGFSEKEKKIIIEASKNISILLSSNFSIGINIILKLIAETTQILGNNSDINIIESHHRNKIDAPSGTALTIGKRIAKEMKWDFKDSANFSQNQKNEIRKKNKIEFSSIRAGDIVGKHSTIFTNADEQINITHTAFHRNTFAKGAIQAAIWISQKKTTGMFDMNNVLSFKKIPESHF